MPPLTFKKINRKIKRLKPDKIPGLNKIFNRALKITEFLFILIFLKIFNIYIRLGHQPIYFKNSITVALRKSNKKNYI